MANTTIDRLEQRKEITLLEQLASAVEKKRKQIRKLHEVWELSFDWKDCRSYNFASQKINYMHNNPCTGKWQLASIPIKYMHSSARFYLTGAQGIYLGYQFHGNGRD